MAIQSLFLILLVLLVLLVLGVPISYSIGISSLVVKDGERGGRAAGV